MLRSIFTSLLIFCSCCCSAQVKDSIAFLGQYLEKEHLKPVVYKLASKKMGGRETGQKGQKKAARYLAEQMKKAGLSPGGDSGTYLQAFKAKLRNGLEVSSENVIGYIPGSEIPGEVVIVSAHYDHLGYRNGKLHPGADDNASGSAAVIGIANAMSAAVKKGMKPRRTILFLLVSGEEKGLLGSSHYVKFPLFALNQCVADLNIDMIGRVDSVHQANPGYVYIIGSDMMSTELHRINEEANKSCCGLNLDYTYNSTTDPNRFYYRSDHYNFASRGVPVVFYFDGLHKDYHKPSDTADKIDFNMLQKRSTLVMYTLWDICNRGKRPLIDR